MDRSISGAGIGRVAGCQGAEPGIIAQLPTKDDKGREVSALSSTVPQTPSRSGFDNHGLTAVSFNERTTAASHPGSGPYDNVNFALLPSMEHACPEVYRYALEVNKTILTSKTMEKKKMPPACVANLSRYIEEPNIEKIKSNTFRFIVMYLEEGNECGRLMVACNDFGYTLHELNECRQQGKSPLDLAREIVERSKT